MKERGLIRIIILLSGALLWVAYLFDAVCSRYAIYEVIGYGAHELLSMLPYVSALTTAVWLAITLVKGARGKTLRRELAFCGALAVLLAVQLKGLKGEYAAYMVMAAGAFIFFYGTGKLKDILEALERIQGYIKVNSVYLVTLLKMVGITYVAEFASGICKDAGYGSLGNQIEIFGKLSILGISMPILLALFGTLETFLG